MGNDKNEDVPLSGALAVTAAAFASVSLRTHFSVTHALSAARLTREAVTTEESAEAPDPAVELVRAYATAAIMLSAAFLEATINEFFTDFVEAQVPEAWRPVLSPSQVNLAARLWDSAELERLSILSKFDAALALFAAAPFDRGSQPYQDARLVISVRNALVHARPVTQSDDEKNSTAEAVRLSKQMRGKFPKNRFMGGNAEFPDGLLGAGGARWAFSTCLALSDHFFIKLGVQPRYEQFRPQLQIPVALSREPSPGH